MALTMTELPTGSIPVLDHGFVRLDDAMASDLSVVNAARVSFGRRKEAMDESDEGLVRFLMRDRHGTPFEHNAFRFHIRCPIFVAREWFRHRVGCLTGDTRVTFVSCEGHAVRERTLDELWRTWSEGDVNGHALGSAEGDDVIRLHSSGEGIRAISRTVGIGRSVRSHLSGRNARRDGRWRVRRMRLRVLNEGTNEFTHGHISAVVEKGVQPVYRLTLVDGTSLNLTENHRVLTDRGWATMAEAVGLRGRGPDAVMSRPCSLLRNGVPAYRDREWARSRNWNGGLRGDRASLVTTHLHKAGIREARSGPRSNFWRGGISSDRASVARWTHEQAPRVHERYGCHRKLHASIDAETRFARAFAPNDIPLEAVNPPRRRGVRLTAHAVAVQRIEYVGMEQTYDLCVDGPWHNFVANGVVVHNSFNEFSMRYARAVDEFYVPAAEDVRSQVGKPGAYSFEPVDPELADETRRELQAVYEAAYETYERLVERGVARELARAVLPVGAYTEFYWTVNARALMNFVSLRAAETAQREIRRYAEACERFFAERMPVTYAAFVANDRVAP